MGWPESRHLGGFRRCLQRRQVVDMVCFKSKSSSGGNVQDIIPAISQPIEMTEDTSTTNRHKLADSNGNSNGES